MQRGFWQAYMRCVLPLLSFFFFFFNYYQSTVATSTTTKTTKTTKTTTTRKTQTKAPYCNRRFIREWPVLYTRTHICALTAVTTMKTTKTTKHTQIRATKTRFVIRCCKRKNIWVYPIYWREYLEYEIEGQLTQSSFQLLWFFLSFLGWVSCAQQYKLLRNGSTAPILTMENQVSSFFSRHVMVVFC